MVPLVRATGAPRLSEACEKRDDGSREGKVKKAMQTNTIILAAAGAGLLATLPSCARVAVEPIEVKPIHITVDVNVRVDRELDQFFAFEEEVARPAGPAQPTTAPASTPANGPARGAETVKAEG